MKLPKPSLEKLAKEQRLKQTQIKTAMQLLIRELGELDTELFIRSLLTEAGDYTSWQASFFDKNETYATQKPIKNLILTLPPQKCCTFGEIFIGQK